ncbi:MAG: thiamine pyrophosphate-binding protein [Acidobacteriota bacterium]
MPRCVDVVARTLAEAGITRMFGLPGGEILDLIEAARRIGIEFVLTRHEAAASFMADVTGQIQRRPGVCVSTLGPGAVNMTLGVANAYLDRSPVLAITATLARSAAPFTTHQHLDLEALYRPITKLSVTLDGQDTAAKVRRAWRCAVEPRMGPVHIAIPSDVARAEDREVRAPESIALDPPAVPAPPPDAIRTLAAEIRGARRPVVILGLDLDPATAPGPVRAFVEHLGAPVFVTPKAKGILPEDHPLFFGVCAGVSADPVIVDSFGRADLLVGIGFDPVESDKLWHQTMKLVSLAPVTIAAGAYRPHAEAVGDIARGLEALSATPFEAFEWQDDRLAAFRERMRQALCPHRTPGARLSPTLVTERLRELLPRDTILTTDVGAVKFVVSQVWRAFEPLTFFESNGLSSMSYGFPAAMAARLLFPGRPVVCTIGDGGLGMTMAEIETCVRHGIHFVTIVYNDDGLSLIRVVQENRGYVDYGVGYRPVDFAAVARAHGAWGRRVASLDDLTDAVREAIGRDCPSVIDVPIDPAEYRAHLAPARAAG